MKKLLNCFVVILLVFCMSGCGSKSTDPSETQKKIENSGWEIKFERDAGTLVDYLNLIIDDEQSFNMTRNKEKDSIDYIGFVYNTKEYKYCVDYDMKDKDNDGTVFFNDEDRLGNGYCYGYNLTDDTQDEQWKELSECPSNVKKELSEVLDMREQILSENDLSIEELYDWAKWYYENN